MNAICHGIAHWLSSEKVYSVGCRIPGKILYVSTCGVDGVPPGGVKAFGVPDVGFVPTARFGFGA